MSCKVACSFTSQGWEAIVDALDTGTVQGWQSSLLGRQAHQQCLPIHPVFLFLRHVGHAAGLAVRSIQALQAHRACPLRAAQTTGSVSAKQRTMQWPQILQWLVLGLRHIWQVEQNFSCLPLGRRRSHCPKLSCKLIW